MLPPMALWSIICVVTFLFARSTRSHDYGAFFRNLLVSVPASPSRQSAGVRAGSV